MRLCVYFVLLEIIPLQAVTTQFPPFHQTDYELKLHHMEIINYNREYMKNPKAEIKWYNRTQRVITASAYLLKNLTADIKIDIQVYKFLSNEYRFFPVTINFHMCEALSHNYFGLAQTIKKYSNICCPPRAEFYHLDNAIFDFSAFPPHIPSGAYKLTANCSYISEFYLELHFYGSVNTYFKW